MLQINQIKMNIGHSEEQLYAKIAHMLRISEQEIVSVELIRRSVDARKKPDIYYNYTVGVHLKDEEKVWQKVQNGRFQIQKSDPVKYEFPLSGEREQELPTVIVGTGPAGLFCGYYLALHGYRPILLERGKDVETRRKDVETFWESGVLNPNSNVQFGEGGAGTFSDGKLNTVVKDKDGRNREILETFVKFGAPESILYDAKPHIGTDVLMGIVKSMREELIRLGGQVRFESCVTDVHIEDGRVVGVLVNDYEELPCSELVLAIGHSARDTFEILYERELPMEAKPFAVGLRVEHPQFLINRSQYGDDISEELGAAAYKVTASTSSGRGVYSFCMCPGGYVVNASSENGRLAVNGMSYSGRSGRNANSAIVVQVKTGDFGSDHPLAGMAFQRQLETKAFQLAKGKIPAQRYGIFQKCVEKDVSQEELFVQDEWLIPDEYETTFQPECKGEFAWADVSRILPKEYNQAIVEGMEVFGNQIEGFDSQDAILLGVESRTSSPVRISRDDSLQSQVRGIYPCGEGAGYAGGITSAAMDGLRVAEEIAKKYARRKV